MHVCDGGRNSYHDYCVMEIESEEIRIRASMHKLHVPRLVCDEGWKGSKANSMPHNCR